MIKLEWFPCFHTKGYQLSFSFSSTDFFMIVMSYSKKKRCKNHLNQRNISGWRHVDNLQWVTANNTLEGERKHLRFWTEHLSSYQTQLSLWCLHTSLRKQEVKYKRRYKVRKLKVFSMNFDFSEQQFLYQLLKVVCDICCQWY